MKLGYTLDYKLGCIYVDYDLEFLSYMYTHVYLIQSESY